MNLLENYIKEIHSEKPYTEEWTKKFPDRKFVEVDITVDSYGGIKRIQDVYNTVEWDEIKKKGYYMA